MSDKDSLLSMGFSEARVAAALKKTRNAGLQPALDYLEAHPDEPTPGEESEPEDEAAKIKRLEGEGEAKSLRCSDCGKPFRSQVAAEYHATKTGHENFEESTEEIKPLTEEEKKVRLEELRAQMAIKKQQQAKLDAEDAKKNEAIRRKAGKDSGAIKDEMKLKEAEKEALQRVKDKKADADARARIKAQIEVDKRERADKAAKEKALRDGQPVPQQDSKPSGPSTIAPASSSTASTARIQIRPPEGSPISTTLQATDTLQAVIDFVTAQRPEYASAKLSTTFPRKMFGPSDMTKSLRDLGLTPSAALALTV